MRTAFLSLALLASACLGGQPANETAAKGTSERKLSTPGTKIQSLGQVSDHAGILPASLEAALVARLSGLEAKTGHQLAVVTVNSLEGQDIDTFTLDLFNKWGVGRADHDDGIVLLVAPNEWQVRITVGYGLEGRLTDEVCKRIIDETILPQFRAGDLKGGVDKGTDALIRELS